MKVRNKQELWLFVGVVSVLSVSASLVVTALVSPTGLDATSAVPAFVVPLIVSPVASYWCAAMMLRIHGLNVTLGHMLLHDQMTGLLNRRAFFDAMERDLAQKAGTVLMLDIDSFKAINDTYGHPTGDDVIQSVARVLKQKSVPHGRAARLGGEEFAVFFPDEPLDAGHWRAEDIRTAIAAQSVQSHAGAVACTVSIGLDYRRGTEPADDVLKRADEALYEAKNRGRNQVYLFRPPDSKDSDVA